MKIASINIESSFTKFIDSQEIKIPSDKKTNCIFIYGKNGSGKSSISKLFYTKEALEAFNEICNMLGIQEIVNKKIEEV